MSALVAASFAAARRHLAAARDAQRLAILAGLDIYRAGRRGAVARMMRTNHDRQRAAHLEEALRVRAKIKPLRAELVRLERATTEPPRLAAEGERHAL